MQQLVSREMIAGRFIMTKMVAITPSSKVNLLKQLQGHQKPFMSGGKWLQVQQPPPQHQQHL